MNNIKYLFITIQNHLLKNISTTTSSELVAKKDIKTTFLARSDSMVVLPWGGIAFFIRFGTRMCPKVSPSGIVRGHLGLPSYKIECPSLSGFVTVGLLFSLKAKGEKNDIGSVINGAYRLLPE